MCVVLCFRRHCLRDFFVNPTSPQTAGITVSRILTGRSFVVHLSMPTITKADVGSFDFDSTTEMDIVKEIDEFLEEYTSDSSEQSKNFNHTNNFDGDLKEDNNSLNNNDIEFIGKNSAVFHLLEDYEEYGVYEHIPNVCNWNVFYRTLPPGEINYSIKQEPRNDDYASNDTTFSNNEMENFFFSSENVQNSSFQPPKIKLEPCSIVNEQNQGDITSKENSNEQFTNTSTTLDVINSKTAMDNFSFSFNNINNFENSSIQPPKIKLEPCSTVNKQNQEDTFLEETPCTTFSIGKLNEIENFSFLQNVNKIQGDITSKENSNEQLTNTSITLDVINSKTAMDNFSFSFNNINNVEVCHDNKEKIICNPLEKEKNTKHDVNFVLHHVVLDYLCPASLVGSTVKFTSRKLANTCIRNELNAALNSYGKLENFWWTPDDLFFATFTLRSTAQHVFKIYPKNPTSSY